MEPAMRFELMTSSLPRRRSTTELRGRESTTNRESKHWSGRRDSNSRPSAWKADALPTELHPPTTISDCEFRIAELIPCNRFTKHRDAFRNPQSVWFRVEDLNLRKAVKPAGFTARCH